MVTKGSVLVVDDEINLCRIIGAKLARSGYSVVAVHDGLQAVEKVRESDFDVVLLDLILPKMDGLKALAEIRGMRAGLPVIIMTACESNDTLEQAKIFGVSAYVNKPFDLDNLVSLVSSTSQTGVGTRGRKLPDSTVLFSANQPITLEIPNGGSPKSYFTHITDKDERTLSILAPRNEYGFVELAPRTSVRIGLVGQDAHYSFTTNVLKSINDSERIFVLDKPNVIYRVQRRQHPRLPLRVPVRFTPCSEEAQDIVAFKSGETRDISIGGASILVPNDVLPGEMLKLELRPKTKKDQIHATAQVLRSKPADEPGDKGFYLGCQFIVADASLQKLLKD